MRTSVTRGLTLIYSKSTISYTIFISPENRSIALASVIIINYSTKFMFILGYVLYICLYLLQVKAATGEDVPAEELGGADLHCRLVKNKTVKPVLT